jgi:hypothetical protein
LETELDRRGGHRMNKTAVPKKDIPRRCLARRKEAADAAAKAIAEGGGRTVGGNSTAVPPEVAAEQPATPAVPGAATIDAPAAKGPRIVKGAPNEFRDFDCTPAEGGLHRILDKADVRWLVLRAQHPVEEEPEGDPEGPEETLRAAASAASFRRAKQRRGMSFLGTAVLFMRWPPRRSSSFSKAQ